MMLTRLLLALTVLVMSSATQVRGAESVSPQVPPESAPQEVLSPAQRGRAIFAEADVRNSGYVDLQVSLQMILRSPRGVASQRNLRIQQFEIPTDGDRMLVVFDSPADVRGTALLSHAHSVKDDDQWLWLPAIKRVKKISSHNKSGSFVGSEFSYQDLSPVELDKYSYRYIRDDMANGVKVFVVERISNEKSYQYSSEQFWIDQANYRVLRVDYFDKVDAPVKKLEASDYQLYEERFWKAGRMLMTNLRNNKSTELVWQDYRFGVGLDGNRDFSVNSLRRAR